MDDLSRAELLDSLGAPRDPSGAPLCIIAHTTKGKGVSFMEDTVDWHYLPMSEAQYQQAVTELDRIEAELAR